MVVNEIFTSPRDFNNYWYSEKFAYTSSLFMKTVNNDYTTKIVKIFYC